MLGPVKIWLVLFLEPSSRHTQRNSIFRKDIMGDGFTMFQFSIYIRHCPSKEVANMHIERVKKMLPPNGNVGILCITDKQFGEMEIFSCKKQCQAKREPQQLELF